MLSLHTGVWYVVGLETIWTDTSVAFSRASKNILGLNNRKKKSKVSFSMQPFAGSYFAECSTGLCNLIKLVLSYHSPFVFVARERI